MALELEQERKLRKQEEQQRQEAEQLAQENAEKLSQAQSQLAELEREHHPDADLPSRDSDGDGVDGDTLSLQEAIDSEHDKFKAHRAGPDSGKQFVPDPDIFVLAAKM